MALGFEQTATGYRATDAQVEWWKARDLCPSCSAIVSPVKVDADGAKHYRCDCNGVVEWGCYSPADTADLPVDPRNDPAKRQPGCAGGMWCRCEVSTPCGYVAG